jgi:hypothetical protein
MWRMVKLVEECCGWWDSVDVYWLLCDADEWWYRCLEKMISSYDENRKGMVSCMVSCLVVRVGMEEVEEGDVGWDECMVVDKINPFIHSFIHSLNRGMSFMRGMWFTFVWCALLFSFCCWIELNWIELNWIELDWRGRKGKEMVTLYDENR